MRSPSPPPPPRCKNLCLVTFSLGRIVKENTDDVVCVCVCVCVSCQREAMGKILRKSPEDGRKTTHITMSGVNLTFIKCGQTLISDALCTHTLSKMKIVGKQGRQRNTTKGRRGTLKVSEIEARQRYLGFRD